MADRPSVDESIRKDKRREYLRAWKERNPDKMRASRLRELSADPERRKARYRAYYRANRQKRLEQEKRRRAKNHVAILEREKERRIAHPEQHREYSKRFAASYPHKTRLYATRKAAREKGLVCDLDSEWFEERMKRGKCEMSGLLFDGTAKRGPNSPSIDRIDPNGNYTKENCRMIIWWLNRAMSLLGEDYAIMVFHSVLRLRGIVPA